MKTKDFKELAERTPSRQLERLRSQRSDLQEKLNACASCVILNRPQPYDEDEVYAEWLFVHNQIVELEASNNG